MARNVHQVYIDNPSTTAPNTALLYLGKNPFAPTDDSAILYSDLFTQIQGSIGTLDILMSPNKSIKTGTSLGNSYSMQAYDVDGATYKDFIQFVANNTPSCSIGAPSGGSLTIDGAVLGGNSPITISQATSITSNAFVANGNIDLNNANTIRFFNPLGTFFTAFKGGAAVADTTYIWPLAYPSLTSKALVSDITGTMTWETFGDVVGPASSISGALAFYADTGGKTLASSANIVWDNTNNNLFCGAGSNSINTSTGCVILGGTGGDITSVSYGFIIGGTNNDVNNNVFNSGILGGAANLVQGDRSIAFGGQSNTISGSDSYVFGFKSIAAHNTSFVFSDGSGVTGLQTTADYQFLIRATGGFGFIGASMNLASFDNNFINIYSDTVANRAKLQYKNNGGIVSTTILDVLQVKGDIYTFNSTINDRLAVGSTNQVLQANAATTTGLEWTSTLSNLTSVQAGDLTMAADAIIGTGAIVTIAAFTSGSPINLSSNGAFVSITDFANSAAQALRFYNAGGTHYVGFKTTDGLAADTTWTWPTTDSTGIQAFVSDGSGALSWASIPGAPTNTSYTPTLTNTANVAASTAYTTYYADFGTYVIVWGRVDVDPTTVTTLTQLDLSLPSTINNFAFSYEAGGTAASYATVDSAIGVIAVPSTKTVRLSWVTADVTNHAITFSFTYQKV